MKTGTLILAFLFSYARPNAQSISYADFKGLIPYLQSEDWKSTFKESSKLLKYADKDSSDFHAIVLYIHIFSAAGMVTKKQMSYKELEKDVMKYKGQRIIMAAHPVSGDNQNSMRQTLFSNTDSTNEAFTTATNAKGTNILCFEKFFFNEKINPSEFENSFVRCGGTLQEIETNPRKSLLWILRLTVTNAFARKAS